MVLFVPEFSTHSELKFIFLTQSIIKFVKQNKFNIWKRDLKLTDTRRSLGN